MERKRKWSYHFYAHHSPSIGRSNDFGATCIRPKIYGKWSKLRWLERLFKCYKPFETREKNKEVFLSMWEFYEYLDNSFIRQYFKASCDGIGVTTTTLKVHKKNAQISVFVNYPKN